jgi:hypothetical protein
MANLELLLVIMLALTLYLFPALVATSRNHHNSGSIIITNLFLGWTFLGWVVALAMACSQVHPDGGIR